MASLASCRSALFARLVPVVEALGGVSSETTDLILYRATKYTEELGAVLSTDYGFKTYLKAFERRSASDENVSETWGGAIRAAMDEYLYPQLCRMRWWNTRDRSKRLEHIFPTLRGDILDYLHGRQLATPVPPHLVAQTLPPKHTSALDSSSHALQLAHYYATSSDAHVSGSSSSESCASPETSAESLELLTPLDYHAPWSFDTPACETAQPSFISESDGWVIASHCDSLLRMRTAMSYHSLATSQDPRYRIAAGQLEHLDFLGNHEHLHHFLPDPRYDIPPEQLATVAMLRDVAPQIVSLRIDMPFRVESDEPVPAAAPFEFLQYLAIDFINPPIWKEGRAVETLQHLRADLVPNLRFINARAQDLERCGALVLLPEKCIIVHDFEDRHIVFHDRRGFERYISGELINTVPEMFGALFLSTITDLTLRESMPISEIQLLYAGFPRGLTHLRLWFGGFSSTNGVQAGLLGYRDAGYNCCAHLEQLVLTMEPPVEGVGQGDPQHSTRVLDALDVHGFVGHIHGREPYWRLPLAAPRNPQIIYKGIHCEYNM